MNDLETSLRAAPLASPSADLDRRIDRLFSVPAPTRRTPRPLFLGYWLTGLGAFGATAALLLVPPLSPVAPAPVICRIPPQGRMLQFLVEAPRTTGPIPGFVTHVSR